MNKSLIDADFVEFDNVHDSSKEKEPMLEVLADNLSVKEKEPDPIKIEVEVANDTPEKDRGKWVADDSRDGEPEIPTEEEIKSYSADVQKRINKLTARIHAERRAREERDRMNEEAIALTRRLMQENNVLKDVLENGEKALLGEHKGRLEGQMKAAKSAYREAVEASDVNGQIAAQEEMAKIAAQMDRLSVQRSQTLPRSDEKELEKFVTPQPTNQPSPAAAEWQARNQWFLQDELMTAYAMSVDAHLVKSGVQRDTPAYYQAIDKEMRQRFAEKFQTERREQPRRQQSVVAPANRSAGQPQKVQLSESEARLARRLGITLEQYAKSKMATEQNKNPFE